MKRVIPAVKGTRDFYPEQMAVRTWLYSTARAVAESFGYQEYEAPILESLALYVARSGDELVKDQAYVFQDRGGDQIALRPELTASLARMIAQRQGELAFPVRWWSFGPFWRYERPQRGRTREFFQWNVDMLGASSPEADAENVAVLATFLQRVGLTPKQVLVLVNDRRLMDRSFDRLGIAAGPPAGTLGSARPTHARWLRTPGARPRPNWGFPPRNWRIWRRCCATRTCGKPATNLRRFFAGDRGAGCSETTCASMRPSCGDCSTTRARCSRPGRWAVRSGAPSWGAGDTTTCCPTLGAARCRPSDFALGDVVMTLLLEKYGLLPDDLRVYPAPILVTVFDAEHQSSLTAACRRSCAELGLAVALYPDAEKLARQFKYADRIQARVAVVVGPDEVRA